MPRNKNCTACDLRKTCQYICLWGDGNHKAKVMVIGEAPGKDEDGSGKPFVGKAGRLLSSLLEDVGLKREDVYISNAVKCRPPQNRTPTRKELIACRKYILDEIRTVCPRLIICVGGSAIKAVMNDYRLSVAKARTSKFKIFDAVVRTTFHPASVFRVPYNYKLMQEDLARYFGKSKPEVHEIHRQVGMIKFSDLENQLKLFAKRGDVVIDIETNGLEPFKKDARIWTVGFSVDAGASFVLPVHHKEGHNPDPARSLELISQILLENKNVRIIGHNVKFDLKWLRRFGAKIKCRVFDTMIAFHLLDENYPNKSLKHLARLHTDLGDYAKEVKELQKSKEYPDMQFPLEKLVIYNGNDCDATMRIFQLFSARLKEEKLMRYMRFQMEVLKTLLEMEANGVRVDQEKLNVLVESYSNQLKEKEEAIRKEFGAINLDSTKQLARVLYQELKLPVMKRTPSGAPSTDSEALGLLARRFKSAQALIDRRKITKILNTYLYGKAAQIQADGCIHTTFFMASNREGEERGGTVTGRLGSDMQQIPKVGGIKSMFVSRFKNGTICQADYSQIELRVMAHFSRDRNMLETFQHEDADIHRAVAAKVYGKPEAQISPLERAATKTINFGVIYCIGPNALAAQLECSASRAKRFMSEWFAQFPGVQRWIRDTENQVIRDGFVETLFGRRRRLLGASRVDGTGREVMRQGVNSPIQGSAVDLTLLGMALLHKWMERNHFKSKLILTVHDSILVDVYPGEKDDLDHEIHAIFENLPLKELFGIDLLVPLKMDVAFGRTWEDCEEYEKKVDTKAA